jgi:hypothetical protein
VSDEVVGGENRRASLTNSGGFLFGETFERFVEAGVGGRRGLTEFDVGFFNRDGRLEALLVERRS